ncbi:hypothetical protein [Aquitalea palustris]|uniref:hypothetical protein n=1 Tax=Aquitalea palustris TaxID=2480983 RepID=UPI00131449E1|nr:hypothetical protein [Aquitalea palustris]
MLVRFCTRTVFYDEFMLLIGAFRINGTAAVRGGVLLAKPALLPQACSSQSSL